LIRLALGGAIAALILLGWLSVGADEWQVRIGFLRRFSVTLDFRDTWILLGLVIVLGWAAGSAVDRSAWVPGSERLVSAFLLAVLVSWLLALMRVRLAAYLILAVAAIPPIVLVTLPAPLVGRKTAPELGAINKWFSNLVGQPRQAILIGLLALMVVTAFWTSWWVFRRQNGLVALLPTGTIVAVEILNDPSTGLVFFTLLWLAASAMILLRLNFVALKQRWRSLRVPRAADSGWTFGEIGFEATAILLLAAFLLPPLSSEDISSIFVPGSVNAQNFHPFGLGSGGAQLGPGTIGYSETVRPGSALKAKSQSVMVVSGDVPLYYPYWRGIALGGWDGLQWYKLPSAPQYPVRVQPRLESGQFLAREELPADATLEQAHNTFRMLLPPGFVNSTVFSAGEVLSVEKHPWSAIGVSAAATGAFAAVDLVRLIDNPHQPYEYMVTTAISRADVKSLREASLNYPAWLEPYRELYARGRVAAGTQRDSEVAALAARIVNEAGAHNPYDMAKAIESYLRDQSLFTYTLEPPTAPAGAGWTPLDFFLLESHRGYCQDFSTAMAVMLRTLRIPVRQMSGYVVGNYDDKTHRIYVNSLDAHSWVEVFFPGYGWIPFEPTPDGQNTPVIRPLTAADLNDTSSGAAQQSAKPRADIRELLPADAGGPNAWFNPLSQVLLVALGVLLLVVLALLAAWRWLAGAKDSPRIWRRLVFLADRLHLPRRPGDTPNELGARLASSLPQLGSELQVIARLHTRSRYRRGGLGWADQAELKSTWGRLRKSYPGVLARALRDNLRNRTVRKEEAARSGSRGRQGRR
jgi:hypothetical protein